MKKSTERNRLKRMERDAKQLFLNGLVTNSGLDTINKQIKSAMNKLKNC